MLITKRIGPMTLSACSYVRFGVYRRAVTDRYGQHGAFGFLFGSLFDMSKDPQTVPPVYAYI